MNKRIAFVGIGNPLAGDDGAGIEIVNRLEKRLSFQEKKDFLFYTITEDLFVVTEYLPFANQFIFLDAFYGEKIGEIVNFREDYENNTRHSLSFHQTDIFTVMCVLKKLKIYEPFPEWEVWGVTISPPSFLSTRLSEDVNKALNQVVDLLVEKFLYKR